MNWRKKSTSRKSCEGEKLGERYLKEMLDGSIATPSLVAAIIHSKYTNAIPLYRQEQELIRNEINILRQTMANWIITTAGRYFSLVYETIRRNRKESCDPC